MSDSKIREEFDIWHREQINMLIVAGEPTAARIARQLEPVYWCAWQASREALVIKLPSPMLGPEIDDADDDYEQFEAHENTAIEVNAMRREFRKAVEAAGLKVAQ